jgi:hypothetical protein
MGIFLTAADILLLYDLRLDPASVLKPQARRHFVGGNINTPPCSCGRRPT